jgi:hypothetical protein
MSEIPNFTLRFIRQENHLMLSEVTSILVTQNLYDILFQYVISPEKEKQLEDFIKILEKYIKSKPTGPFSMPVADLKFLEEGIEELKLLNWREIPVSLFQIVMEDSSAETTSDSEQLDSVLNLLSGLMLFNRSAVPGQIYIYPTGLITI